MITLITYIFFNGYPAVAMWEVNTIIALAVVFGIINTWRSYREENYR